jgi:hypothetical protein
MALYPWSWSKVNSYLTCPRQHYELDIAKRWPKDSDASYLLWGNEVHKALELELMEGKPLEGRFSFLQPLATELAAIPGDHYGEQKLAVDIELKPVEYNSEYAYARCIIDRLIILDKHADTLDYKTGKRKSGSRQLALCTAITMANFPDVEVSDTAYIWTQGGKPTRERFTRADLPKIWDGFRLNISEMEWSYANNAWPANPSGLCGPNKAGTYAGCAVLDCPHNRRPDAIRRKR